MMAERTRSTLNRGVAEEVKHLVKELSFDTGEVTVDEIVSILLPNFEFDAEKAKRTMCARLVRNSIGTMRDAEGNRIFIATGSNGNYAHIRRCFEIRKMRNAHEFLSEKIKGETRTLNKVNEQIGKIQETYEALTKNENPVSVSSTDEA
jgi:hypothetical protein